MMIADLREQFPQLKETVYGKPLVYLDNAATSLRPMSVIDSWTQMSLVKNSNLHRAVHHTADIATSEYETARNDVKEFINAESREEIIFTSGATHSLNLVAYSFSEAFLGEGDEVLVDEDSHHSNILPWQLACNRKKAVLKHFDPSLPVENFLSEKTRIVCISHISNVLGLVNPVKEIAVKCHKRGIPLLVDGAQGIVHEIVDVQELDCDFYAFSGHKMYAAPGTGVLYGKKNLMDRMPPFMSGGEMIETVKWTGSTYAALPQKFEAGTQNISGTPTLSEAIDIMRQMRCKEIGESQDKIVKYLLEELPKIPELKIFGLPDGRKKVPVFSFSIEGVHHEDLALILDKMGIAVRSGQMCAEPLMDKSGVSGMLRASFAPYNTVQEAEYFIESLNKAVEMLR